MSFVNLEKKYIFIHVPKTAGSSMELLCGGSGHETIYDYSLNNDINNYFKWCFIRNPFDRLVSAYFHDPITILGNYHVDNFTDFVDIVYDKLYINFVIPENFVGISYSNYFIMIQAIPQYLLLSINNSITMDFIGRFENLIEDWNFVANKFCLDYTLPRSRIGKHEHYSTYYNSESKKKVEAIYAKDFELFEYSKNIEELEHKENIHTLI